MTSLGDQFGLSSHPYAMKLHDATRLHFDLRLEWNGVLLSWALPSNICCLVNVDYEAVEMEDHKLANIRFEGLHATGPIMLWDEGAWEPLPDYNDVIASLHRGQLRFRLLGGRLKGNWRLVKTSRFRGSKRIWLLRMEAGSAPAGNAHRYVLDLWPNSIETQRSMQRIHLDWEASDRSRRNQPGLFD